MSLEPVKKVLLKCPHIESINLSSCRALPRGMKRLYTGKEIQDLKDSLDPEKIKAKENKKEEESSKTKKSVKKSAADSKSESVSQDNSADISDKSDVKKDTTSTKEVTSPVFQEPKSLSESPSATAEKHSGRDSSKRTPVISSPDSKTLEQKYGKEMIAAVPEGKRSTRGTTPKLLSPATQLRPDSSSTPRSDPIKDLGSPHFSPVPKPDSQVQNSPEVQTDLLNPSQKSSSWNLGQFKTTPTHKSEASPLSRLDTHTKLKHGKVIEQCSPTTSHDNKPSPETHSIKQDSMKNPSWNYGNYSPMPRQESQFSSQRSPYSAQPSPAQPSPYSTQPSPYSTQPSPYSSQPSPYSAQPSPDTSQIVKPELQKSSAWNTGNYSPMPKHHPPFSPHPSTHASPDPGVGLKTDSLRNNPNKTPGHSPMSRQDRIHHSPYSPRPSVDVNYSNKKSPGVGNYSPMMRPDCHLPSPDRGSTARPTMAGRQQDIYGRTVNKAPDILHNSAPQPEIPNSWGIDRFNQITNATTSAIESLVWGATSFNTEPAPMPPRVDNIPTMLNTPSPQTWSGLPPFENSVQRQNDDLNDPWTFGQFREQPHHVHNAFVDQNSFDLTAHLGHQAHSLQSYLEDNFPETSRVE